MTEKEEEQVAKAGKEQLRASRGVAQREKVKEVSEGGAGNELAAALARRNANKKQIK